jgi:hypothetical protein
VEHRAAAGTSAESVRRPAILLRAAGFRVLSGRMAKRGDGSRTRTLPDERRGMWFDEPDPVTMLKVDGSAVSFELARDRRRFTLGSDADCDLSLPGEYLSRLHCVIERRGTKLRVYDQDSKNGTYFKGLRESSFDVRPGDTFTAAPVRFLAMSDAMRAAYPTLVEIVGAEEEHALHVTETSWPSASAVLVYAMGTRNLLITGEPGCDQRRLAWTIHGASLLHGRPIVAIDRIPDERAAQRELLERAARTTLVLTIDKSTPVVDAAFASMVFSSELHIRTVTIAPSIEKARAVLGEQPVGQMQRIALRPLADRRDMLPRLLDRTLEQRKSPLRFGDLVPANQRALLEHDWPGNLDDLRFAADRLAVIVREGSFRKAAEALGLHRKSLHDWADSIGLSAPLVAG